MTDVVASSVQENGEKKKKQKKLGHEELLRLLSVFEGELQAMVTSLLDCIRYYKSDHPSEAG